ncbi:hypothetical protein CL614_09575 [archaeon]|nr:hypothetical protein [archaeon]
MGVTLKPVIQRNYLAKDFNSFRAELLNYARTYFADKINDFSEASMGGLFLDMAAFVGDSLSFYMDHQFNELNPLTAVETENIVNHLRNAGVPIATVSPAVVSMDFFITVPYEVDELGERRPKRSALPVVEVGTIFSAANGVTFNMVEDLNFAKTTRTGDLIAQTEILDVDSQGLPITYRLKLAVVCISGTEKIEGFSISNVHVPFREIVLATPDVTQIIAVNDSEGNTYYEVSALTQDVVFGGTPTLGKDSEVVEQQMEIIPAPYRFVMKSDPKTKITTLQFGSGKGETLDDDIIPDPSELALPLYGKKTFHRFVIDPNSLLETKSLGISPFNTTISVRYRHAGGLAHNVGAGSIKN